MSGITSKGGSILTIGRNKGPKPGGTILIGILLLLACLITIVAVNALGFLMVDVSDLVDEMTCPSEGTLFEKGDTIDVCIESSRIRLNIPNSPYGLILVDMVREGDRVSLNTDGTCQVSQDGNLECFGATVLEKVAEYQYKVKGCTAEVIPMH